MVPTALLTFLVLEPELLLDLLAGEVDGAAELGAIQSLRDVVGAKLLDEGEQLLPAAVLVQDLQDVGEACGEGGRGSAELEGDPEIPCSSHASPKAGAKRSSSSLASVLCVIPWSPQPVLYPWLWHPSTTPLPKRFLRSLYRM